MNERFIYPRYTVPVVFKYKGLEINVDCPVVAQDRKPSQFEIYLHTCLQGRTYQRVGQDGSIRELRTYMRSKELGENNNHVKTDQGRITISRSEQIKLSHLLTFLENPNDLCELSARICQQKQTSSDKIWLDVLGFSKWLPDPLSNIYKFGNNIARTNLTKYSLLCHAQNTILDSDDRMGRIEEMFQFNVLDMMANDAPFLFRMVFYKKIIEPRRNDSKAGITYPYIDHIEHS